jgi:hypothetical protein
MKILLVTVLVAALGLPALVHGENRILFLDGARIERECTARKGFLEVPLPSAILPESLRIKPSGGTTVLRVEISPAAPDEKIAKQLVALEERREILRDRLKDLDEREGIFKAAAKSQSGRAARKTKSNPDPLTSLRTGTRFTLSQLDSVSAARRQARQSLADIEAKISLLKSKSVPLAAARVWLSSPEGKVRVAYLVSGLTWVPWYDFRFSGNGYVEIALRAKIPPAARSVSTSVVPLSLAESLVTDFTPYPVPSNYATIASFRLPLVKEAVTRGAIPSVSLVFTNSTGQNFPSGEASGYWQGEYFGTSPFAGCLVGKSLSLVFGEQ